MDLHKSVEEFRAPSGADAMAQDETARTPDGWLIGTYRLANTAIRVESLHTNVHRKCRAYRCEDEPELVVRTTEADIAFERGHLHTAVTSSDADLSSAVVDGYLETLAVYRKVAEAMPARGVVLMHGSCVAVDGAAYLFCAPSGTGKSTHARLWRELLGSRAQMVNDDKPLVRVGDGTAIAYGTPWDGKHHLSSDVAVPLRAICIIERAEENHIRAISASEAVPLLLQQVYRPMDPAALTQTLDLLDVLLGSVRLYRLGCTMDISAAALSYDAMRG